MKESLMKRKKKKHKSYELSISKLTNIQNSSNFESKNTFLFIIMFNY